MRASCQCGALSAQMPDDAEPMVIMCHCVDCQKRSGSPFGVIAYYLADTVVTGGEATEYTRSSDSGSTFTNGFCPRCGSSVYAKAGKLPEMIGVTLGTLEGGHGFPPLRSVYEQSRFQWVAVPAGTTSYPRGRDR